MDKGNTSIDVALASVETVGLEVALASSIEGGRTYWDAYVSLPDSWGDPIGEAEDVDPARAIMTALERAVEAQRRPALAA